MIRFCALALSVLLAFSPAALAQTALPVVTGGPQTFLVCVPSPSGVAVSPCGVDSSGSPLSPALESGYVLSSSDYQLFQTASEPFTASQAAEYFTYGFGMVLSCWALAHAIGLVVAQIRRA